MEKQYILAIDQGTSSTKTVLFNDEGNIVSRASVPLNSYYTGSFAEQDPEEIYRNVLESVKLCIREAEKNRREELFIAACGISNQRETFILWDKEGAPLYNAVLWQCRRSVSICERLQQQGHAQIIHEKTGLIIDPYFSATKLIWLAENNQTVRKAIDKGEAFFGTVDTWLLYRLTGGKNYFTDYTNASRTMFFNLNTLAWDEELLHLFNLKNLNLPVCKPSSHFFGQSDFEGILKLKVPLCAMIGDSHAAAFGEGCFHQGEAKATMGTGCSILLNVGKKAKYSGKGMVSTVCWSTKDTVHYALEGIIVSCGATIEWLKNELGLIADSKETESIALSVEDNNGVYLVPSFSGLGAPHWDMTRKASITGLTFSANRKHLVRAALESIPYQVKDILAAMEDETNIELHRLMVDGGISTNTFILQFLADLLQIPVVNIGFPEVSALGAAYLAGLEQNIFRDLDHLLQLNTERKIWSPSGDERIKEWYAKWQRIVTQKEL